MKILLQEKKKKKFRKGNIAYHCSSQGRGGGNLIPKALLRTVLREEARTGKLYVRGHDRGGRAIMYMAPGRENTRDETNQMRFLVYSIERALACTAAEQARRGPDVRSIRPGEEKMCIIIDFDCWTLLGSPPMSTTRLLAI